MAWHDALFPALVTAIRTGKGKSYELQGGTINYRLMEAFTAWIVDPRIVDPRTANQRRCLDLLSEMDESGHLALGAGTEAGAPGMHWTFSVGAVVGGLKWALIRKDQALIVACRQFLEHEIGLDRHFRFRGRVVLPAPRVKDEKRQAPVDGYRDVFVKIALGEPVKKPASYYAEDQAIAVATLREILSTKADPATRESWRNRFAHAPVPKLLLPIRRVELEGGGYEAWIEDTPEARRVLGRDACHRVRNGPEGITYQVDWADKWQKVEMGRRAAMLS